MTPRRKQLSLFGGAEGDEPRRRARVAVEPAPPDPEVEEIAAELPAGLRLGTSSWAFPGWRGLVYASEAPASRLSRTGLAAYAAHPLMRAVGLDRTHYQPLPEDALRDHAEQVDEDFRFLVKAHEWCTLARFPTHPRYGERRGEQNPFFLDPDYARREVIEPTAGGLGNKLGPILFQVAPQSMRPTGGPEAFLDRLHAFLRALPAGPLYAVELRNRELLCDAYRDLLQDTGAVHCINAHPRMPDPALQWRAAGCGRQRALVIRWMLHPGLEYDQALKRYEPFDTLRDADPATRSRIAQLVLHADEHGVPAFVIVNNKAEGSAPLSVRELAREILRARGNRSGDSS